MGEDWPTYNKKKGQLDGHILRRNRLLKQVIEGKREGRIEVTERQGRRRNQLLDDFKETELLEIESGSTRLNCVENSLCKRL